MINSQNLETILYLTCFFFCTYGANLKVFPKSLSFCFLDNVLDNLILCNKLEEIFRDKVRETLLRKHRHHRSCGFRRNLSNIISSRKSSNILHQSSMNGLKNGTTPHIQNGHVNDNGSPKDNQQFELQPKINPPKLFRNFSQPAFPTATSVQLRPHVSFNRADSTQGHLVYPPTSNSGDEESSEKVR